MARDERVILMVEDTEDDALLALRSLRKGNILNKVVLVEDGAEALDYLFGTDADDGRNQKPLPALVLLDLKLPKVGGLEVLRRIRADERTKLLPVIVLTSSDEELDLKTAYELGCNSYIRKPVDFEQFSAAVSQVGLYWLLLNEPPPEPKS